MSQLINKLIAEGTLKSPKIISAFQKIKRKDFMLPETRDESEGNYPFPIGFGQTISQPYTVAFMLELLQPKKSDKILDIGSGSGWTTALLAEIVSSTGQVFAIERIPELKKFGENNVAKYFPFPNPSVHQGGSHVPALKPSIHRGGSPVPALNRVDEVGSGSCVQFLCSDKMSSWKNKSPFNRILVSAAARKIPQDLLDQLKINGRLVIPIGKSSQDIVVVDKISKKEYKETRYPGFIFVPLIR